MSAAHLRLAAHADADAMAQLHALCFAQPWDAASFARLLAREGALGLLATGPGGDPAGFALFDIAADEAEILTLGVRRECRGRGVASALLARGCSELARRGARRLYLEVAVDNTAALALYRRAGFAETGRRPGYYNRGSEAVSVDGLILARPLVPPPGC